MLPDLDQVAEIVIKAAHEELVPRFAEVARTHKTDGSIVTAADIAMQDVVQRELASHWPQFGFLGEEMKETEQRQSWDNPGNGIFHNAGGLLEQIPVISPGTDNFLLKNRFFTIKLRVKYCRKI